jgi:hypothetical protein
MAMFTVHIPPTAAGQTPATEDIVFLRDEFSWPAFIFGPFWLIWSRAWVAALAWTLALALAYAVAWKLRVPNDAMPAISIAFGLALGFEGNRLRAWTLARRGYVESDVVMGHDVEEAEAVFFHRWRAATAPTPEAPELPA